MPVAVALSSVSVLLVPFVFGHRYADAGGILAILAWRIPIVALSSPLGSALVAAGRQRTLMRNNVIAAVVVIGGDLLAIPLVGLAGAAVVSLLGSLVVLALNGRAARSAPAPSPLLRSP